ncbi:hypothetical protein C1646_768365 [Rhizophagus diaphanus]|nr:hypothetical protein C1646_768365 [Rhizophagus diaphanus] [Rhizophagus sp. MUCL 43196]
MLKSISTFLILGDSEKLSKEFIRLQINSNNEDEVYNNPNLNYSKEQDEPEILDDRF